MLFHKNPISRITSTIFWFPWLLKIHKNHIDHFKCGNCGLCGSSKIHGDHTDQYWLTSNMVIVDCVVLQNSRIPGYWFFRRGRNSAYPSLAISSFGMKRSDAELMQ